MGFALLVRQYLILNPGHQHHITLIMKSVRLLPQFDVLDGSSNSMKLRNALVNNLFGESQRNVAHAMAVTLS